MDDLLPCLAISAQDKVKSGEKKLLIGLTKTAHQFYCIMAASQIGDLCSLPLGNNCGQQLAIVGFLRGQKCFIHTLSDVGCSVSVGFHRHMRFSDSYTKRDERSGC